MRSRTAFVLSGGGSLGAIQVGMLTALHEAGVEPDLLVGSSVGAINAAWVATRGTGRYDDLAGVWRSLRRSSVFPARPSAALAMLGLSDHTVPPDALRGVLERHLGDAEFSDARIPVHVIATETVTGLPVVLSEGPLVAALLASAAIPGVFPPVRLGGVELIDGGIASHSPIAEAVELGATRLFVLPAGYACALRRAPASAVGVALHALTLLIQQQVIRDVRMFADRVEINVVPPLCPLAVSPADFSRSAELIDRAHVSTRRWLRSAPARHRPDAVLGLHRAHRLRADGAPGTGRIARRRLRSSGGRALPW